MSYLSEIESPADLKRLAPAELPRLCAEIRDVLIRAVTEKGGHFGSNLGVVELTVALHYVFRSPDDKIVFDVSHQCYTHKLLTGRKAKFLDPVRWHDYTGYSSPAESEHDHFLVGHTSTAVGLALGLAKARTVRGLSHHVIALVGDGALSGGPAFEGLNNAGEADCPLIIVVNDNDMSIAENHGGIYRNLKELRDTRGTAANNIFRACGLDYLYVHDGHDTDALIAAFRTAGEKAKPVVVHVRTRKGNGCAAAERAPEEWHHISAKSVVRPPMAERYDGITKTLLLERAKRDEKLVVICPAVPLNVGADCEFRRLLGGRYIDVGIAEGHALTFAAGLAKGGARPVVLDYGTFLQRAYDQLMFDVAVNGNPVVILDFASNGGISSNDAAHVNMYDLAMMATVPDLLGLAPATKADYTNILTWALTQAKRPVVIRVPQHVRDYAAGPVFDNTNRRSFAVVEEGNTVALLGLGNFYDLARRVQAALAERYGIAATLVNPRVFTEIDTACLDRLVRAHRLVVTMEDGIISFGEKVAAYYGAIPVTVLTYGASREFTDYVPLAELYERYGLTVEHIVRDIALQLGR